ncbi:MAG: tetratricopeptide repeat protein [Nitrospinae bacterium]|nr:tetratricopeptide repeat protein [Nitrospinota bacterium]
MKKTLLITGIFLLFITFIPVNIISTYGQLTENKVDEFLDPTEKAKATVTLDNIRFGPHPENTRLFFDLSQLPEYSIKLKLKEKAVEVQFFDTVINPNLDNLSMQDKNIVKTAITKEGKKVTITFYLKSKDVSFVYLPLSKPARIVLDIRKTSLVKGKILGDKIPVKEVKPEDIKFVKKKIDIDETLDKNPLRKKYYEAMTLYQKFKYTEAEPLLKEILEKYPDFMFNDSVMFTYGIILASKAGTKLNLAKYDPEKYREALRLFTEMLIKFPDTPYRTNVYFINAKMLVELNLYAEAISQLNLIVDDYSKDKFAGQALALSAKLLLEMGEIERGTAAINKMLVSFRDSAGSKQAAFTLADTLFSKGNYLEAFDIYVEAIKYWPEYFKRTPSSIFNLAEIYYMNGDYNLAQRFYYRITNLFPNNVNSAAAMNRLSQIYMLKKDYDGSLKVLTDANKKFKDQVEGLQTKLRLADLGIEHQFKESKLYFDNLPEVQDPFETYKEVIAKSTEKNYKEEAIYRYGVAFSSTNQYRKAIEILNQMVEEYPNSKFKEKSIQEIKKNFNKLIQAYYSQDGFFTVLLTYYKNFEKYLSDIKDPKILLAIAKSYQDLGAYDNAKMFLEKVAEHDTEWKFRESVMISTIEIVNERGEYKKAIDLSDKFLEDFPASDNKINAYRNKGYAFYKLNNLKKAQDAYMQSMFLDREGEDAAKISFILGNIFTAQKKLPQAENAMAEAIEIFNKSVQSEKEPKIPNFIRLAYQNLGNILFEERKYEKAIAANQVILDKFPDYDAAKVSLFQIAESYRLLKNYDDAKKKFEEVVSRYPNTLVAKTALENISAMNWKEKNKRNLAIKPRK